MKKITFFSHSTTETIQLAKRIASVLKKGDLVGLFGDLGSGKTTFVKGLARGLGLLARINSPGFVILKVYSLDKSFKKGSACLYHFDLYRLVSLKELEDIGYDDFINGNGIGVIEWADKAEGLLPQDCLRIKIKIKSTKTRRIDIISSSARYNSLVNCLKAA